MSKSKCTREYYNRFYLHDVEISSLKWLSNNYNPQYLVYADRYSKLKFISFSDIKKYVNEDILPSTIDKNAYVYAGYANKAEEISMIYYKYQEMAHNYSIEFLNKNKNRIYQKSYSEIFK